LRLFVAGRLPDALQAHVFEALSAARRAASQARWAKPGALHLTLAFLGEHDAAVLPALVQALQAVAPRHPAVQLWLHGAGCFGRPHHPEVLFAEVSGDLAPLQGLQADVEEALQPWRPGPRTAAQAFHPHLTLARARGRTGDVALARCQRALRGQVLGGFLLEGLTLFRSELTATGAQHTGLAEFPLGATATAHP
jgi:RNA 2',3'-cyclic 3'-phosphodiesterase